MTLCSYSLTPIYVKHGLYTFYLEQQLKIDKALKKITSALSILDCAQESGCLS